LSLFDHHHSSSSRPPGRSISGPPAEEIGMYIYCIVDHLDFSIYSLVGVIKRPLPFLLLFVLSLVSNFLKKAKASTTIPYHQKIFRDCRSALHPDAVSCVANPPMAAKESRLSKSWNSPSSMSNTQTYLCLLLLLLLFCTHGHNGSSYWCLDPVMRARYARR